MSYSQDGFTKTNVDIPDWVTDDIDETVARQDGRRIAYHCGSVATRFDSQSLRKPGYRLSDIHAGCNGARWLYLHPELHQLASESLGGPVVAFQSLYFEWGSQQALHRDPTFVVSRPFDNLVGVWVALEDVESDAGPLRYVPGSHAGDYFRFPDGQVSKHGQRWPSNVLLQRSGHDQAEAARFGGPVEFTCSRGDVFVWHAGLLHGGAPITSRPMKTRNSMVIHFCREGGVSERKAWIDGKLFRSRSVLVEGNCKGLDGPLS